MAAGRRNKDLLQHGLDLVTEPLHNALRHHYEPRRGSGWFHELVTRSERIRQQDRAAPNDLSTLITLALDGCHQDGFEGRLGQRGAGKRLLHQLRHARNSIAHHNSGDLTPDDVIGELKTVERLLEALDASTMEIQELRDECRRRLGQQHAPTADPPPPPQASIPEREIEEIVKRTIEAHAQRGQEPAPPDGQTTNDPGAGRPAPDPRLDALVDQLSGLKDAVDELRTSTAQPQTSPELAEISERLQQLERSLGDTHSRFDLDRTSDDLLAAREQMRELERREPAAEHDTPAIQSDAKVAPDPQRAPARRRPAATHQPAERQPRSRAGRRAGGGAPARHGKRWSRADDQALLSGWNKGRTVAELAEELGRTATAVASRLRTEHGVNWLVTAPELPQPGETIGWQGLASWVDTALRQRAELVALVGSKHGEQALACRTSVDGQIMVGTAVRKRGQWQLEGDTTVCHSAADASRQLDVLLVDETPDTAQLLFARLDHQPALSQATPEIAVDRLTENAFDKSGPKKVRYVITRNLEELADELGLDLAGWTALDVALAVDDGRITLPAGWAIGKATERCLREGTWKIENGSAVWDT